MAAYINEHERAQAPRRVEGSVQKTRLKFHASHAVNLDLQAVDGVLIGQGTGK